MSFNSGTFPRGRFSSLATGCTLLLLCICSSLLAQQTSASATKTSTSASESSANTETNTPTVSVDVKVVNVMATVRDKHGKILADLTKNDFALQEDSHPVNVQYFSKDSNLPLILGLLVDTSMSQRSVIDQEKSASRAFLDRVLRDKDSAFLIHFDKEVELLQDLTSSHQKLETAIESLQTRSLRDEDNNSRAGGPGSDDDDSRRQGRSRGMHRGGTTLYDAIYLASDELMKKQKGRKALIIVSDGVDRGSKETLESAIEAAQRADTLVYSVYFKGEENFGEHRGGFSYPGMGGPMGGGGRRGGGRREPEEQRPDGKKVLERISKETGGRMFEASSKKEALDKIYASIEEELRNQYSLGFTPDKADSLGYHKVQLTTKQKDDHIQARDGFYLEQ
jgi:VWFA-related protein